MSVMPVGIDQWRSKHWFANKKFVLAAIALVVLFIIGLVLHELSLMSEPVNGWYEQLHEAVSSQPMARWMW